MILFCAIQNELKRWNYWMLGVFLYARFMNWNCHPKFTLSPFIIKCQIQSQDKTITETMWSQNISFLTLFNIKVVLNSLKWIAFRHIQFNLCEIYLFVTGLFGHIRHQEWMRELLLLLQWKFSHILCRGWVVFHF